MRTVKAREAIEPILDIGESNEPNFLKKVFFYIYSTLSISISSKYYSPVEFLESKLPRNFTMLHVNIASLSKHIDELRNLLKLLKHPFDDFEIKRYISKRT